MKRLVKIYNRKGFTLVETLLATVILLVVSTMLINGFVATMGYSFQTSVYNKSAGKNYAACMDSLAEWNSLENVGDEGREVKGKAFCGGNSANAIELEFDTGMWPGKLESVYVGVYKNTNLSLTVPGALPFQSENFAPTDDQLADNRKAIVYYPEYWQQDGVDDSLGKVIVMYVATEGKYYWVIDNNKTDLKDATVINPSPIDPN